MTYNSRDRSAHDGAPLECYRFIGSFREYHYTSYHSPITLGAGGEAITYAPLPIVRTSVETSSVLDSNNTMDILVPEHCDIAKDYAFLLSPRDLQVVVFRTHEGEDYTTQFEVEWVGEALEFSATTDKWAIIKTGSILQSKLNGNNSAVFFQRLCNHILYDVRCKMDREDYTTSATVLKIQGQIITVDNDGVANNLLKAGEIVNTRTGERQSIIDNLTNVIRVGYRFIDLLVGDTVELTQGCNHIRLGDCKLKFNNVVNYGGFDFIPTANPMVRFNNSTTTAVSTTVKEEKAEEAATPKPPPKGYPAWGTT